MKLAEATIEQLRAATRRLTNKPDAETPLELLVSGALHKQGVKGVAIRVRGSRMSLLGVKLEDVNKVGKALATVKMPTPPKGR